MALNFSENWIKPENLKKQMEAEKRLVDSGKFDGGGHFGSYYAYRKGISKNYVKLHTFDDDNFSLLYAKSLKLFLKLNGLDIRGKVLDIGCAMGYITNSLNILNICGETYGVDISDDAIAIAKDKYPKCNFYVHSADDLSIFPNNYFDIIHANEFYPFTRTNDEETHLAYLNKFSKKLKSTGFVILHMNKIKKGFGNIYKEIMPQLENIGFSKIVVMHGVVYKIIKFVPCMLVNKMFYSMLILLSVFIQKIRNKKSAYFYMLKKNA